VILMDEDGVTVSWPVIAITAALSAGLSLWVIGRFMTLRRRAAVTGSHHLVGRLAEARDAFGGTEGPNPTQVGGAPVFGRVHIDGEQWQAHSRVPVQVGRTVRIIAVDGLRLEVEPVAEGHEDAASP
jgi:membrane-bound serine protease (ClpP class)